MLSRQIKALVFLLVVTAVLLIFARLTDSFGTIMASNAFFLALACLFYVFSVVLWLFSWAVLIIKKQPKLQFFGVFLAGCASVYAALDPLQLGSDAMRVILLKDRFGHPYSDTLAASMITKGFKFLFIAALASVSIAFFFLLQADFIFRLALLSGFGIIVLAALLFLLPVNKKIGLKIAGIFRRLGRAWKKFFIAEKFFVTYSNYLADAKKSVLAIVFLLVGFSFFLEFLALYASFAAAGAFASLEIMFSLFILVSILERAPLPRGIGLIEPIGFFFVSINAPAIPAEKIVSAIIIFDIARIIVPSILSLIVYSAITAKSPKKALQGKKQ